MPIRCQTQAIEDDIPIRLFVKWKQGNDFKFLKSCKNEGFLALGYVIGDQ